ncbi:hypothetical protein E1B28_010008 [Marasmius oreades]|uniref:RNA-binding protein VTS1 n=1 Tax=Marasmius oreades TaxID=181124 RepID=A0A9P7URC0_9AGAR|nr:uncharacterized protein E1B28_010008 [Marasmius oreades]KAG7090935.1 hypothetical protein E1B28_010008 [Marasmius oreades]
MPATMLSPQAAVPKPTQTLTGEHHPSSPLRPNAAIFNPILSPRPGGGFGVPPSPRFGVVGGESLDQWFKDLRKYEATLSAMAAASEEPKFREELGTIEQWFTLLTDSEQTASLYTLIQHASQEQLTFLKAVLQQLTDNNVDSRQASPATTRPPLSVRLPGTPRTPGFSLTSALSPATSHNPHTKDLDRAAIAAAAASPVSATEPNSQELFIKPAEEMNWANMVNTPMDLMFQKPQNGAQGILPGMPNMMGMPALNPLVFNQGMMGYSNEAQLLALQLMMSGMTMQPPMAAQTTHNGPKSTSQQRQSQKGQTSGSNNWRSGSNNRTSASKSKDKSSASLSATTTKPEDEVDPELLNDIPAWLKTLRLHKYTDCFKGMTWQEMVVLDEDELEKKGVSALGARRRLTKNFDAVKRKMGMMVDPTPDADADALANAPANPGDITTSTS